MDGRRLLAFGGGVTVAVAVTVASTFAVSNAVELTDVAGEPVSGTPLLVPSHTPAAQTPTATPSAPTPTASPTPEAPVAETVPAPEPRAVTPKPKTPKKPTTGKSDTRDHHPRKTPTPAQSSWQERRDEVEALIAQYEKDGDWGKVKEWIAAQGWSREQADRWVRYIRDHADRDSHDEWNRDGDRRDGRRDDDAKTSSSVTTQTPADAGTLSGHDLPREWTGSKERTIDARFPVGRD